MNSGPDHCRELAKRIQRLLAAGFEADATAVHFINSTFGHPDSPKLQAILNDVDSCDREGLIDLIVSPDAVVCREMEAFLSRTSFSDEDVQAVLSLLPDGMRTSVRVAGLSEPVCFSLPLDGCRRFLSRLNVTRPIDPDIRAALETRLPDQTDRLAALATIRHSRGALDGPQKIFLLQFIRQSGPAAGAQWFTFLETILDLLDRQKSGTAVWDAFGQERQRCLKQMEYSRRLTEQLNKSNMETLLLQGTRIGVLADTAALSRRIQTIDEISLLVWGRVPMAGGLGFQNPDISFILFEKEPPRE